MLIYPDTFTDDARTILFHSGEHARRLGHTHRGGEHYLLALAAADVPVAAVLREQGLTPWQVEEEIVRLEGLGPAAALFGGLDTGSLAAVGVDPAAVRDRIEASFGPEALALAGRAVQEKLPRRPSGLPDGPITRWRIHRHNQRITALPPLPPAPPGSYHYQAAGTESSGRIPPTPDAWDAVNQSVHEAMIRHHTRIRAEHLALAFTAMTTGLVPRILPALGTSAPALRAAILESSWQAS
jgi:Clp amino terminal domain, pathogenicity island component